MRFSARRLAGAAMAALALAIVPVATALPAAALDITTDYPVVNVQAGQDVTIGLTVASAATERVGLSVADVPAGWTAELQGGGFTIGGIYTGPNHSPAVSLHVGVPASATTGSYHVIVAATGADGTEKLDVQLDVVAQASDAYALTSEFADLQGTTTDTYSFSLSLANNTGSDATFGLTSKAPSGWTVTAAPAAQNKASAVDVPAGSKADVSVTAKPPANVEAGSYPIEITATGSGTAVSTKLSVEVVGSAAMTVATANQTLNASGSAGATTDIHLTITNTGTAPLQGVSLASTPPSGWTVTFDPKTVDTVAPGKTADVVAHVQPSGDAITGDYVVTLSASSQVANGSVDIRYTVQTSTWWGLVGVIVIAVAVIALLWLFRRYGRR